MSRSRLGGIGAWMLAISGLLPWFTSGAMSQQLLGRRGWIALIAGLVAVWWHYRPLGADRIDPTIVRAGAAAIGLLVGISGLVLQPPALGPSIGVAVCIVGSLLIGLDVIISRRHADDRAVEVEADASEPATRSTAGRVVRGTAYTLLIALGVLVIWPASPGDLSARGAPATGFDDAVALFEATTADESGRIFEPCESQLMTHGEKVEVAVVLFHGLTNCPKQFVELGTRLHDDGANVLILRAPGHGVANEAGDAIGGLSNVAGLSADELRAYADTSIDIGVGLGDDVRVLGLSMGGVIATWVAQERTDVQRVVAAAPAMTIPTVPAFLTDVLRNVGSKLPNIDLPGQSKLDHAYSGETTKGLTATFLMAEFVADSAYDDAPAAEDVVVVLNPDDDQVDPTHLAAFTTRWADHGDAVSLHRLPATGLPHDVIDPDQPSGDTDLVYPILMTLLADGVAPASR